MSALRELEREATPGPWEFTEPHLVHAAEPDGRPVAALSSFYQRRHADAAFIVALRNAAPALLDLVDAAEEVVRDVLMIEPCNSDASARLRAALERLPR